jgi:integrase
VAAQADGGEFFIPARMTVKEHFDDWLERLRRKGLKPTTLSNHKRHVNLYILPSVGGDTPLHKVTETPLQALCDRLQDEGLKASSIRLIIGTAKSALKYAVRHRRLRFSPADTVELPPKNKPKKAKVFDEREALSFIEEAWRRSEDIIFVFALLTNMRPSEFTGVEYCDLSLVTNEGGAEQGLVQVRQGVTRVEGEWHFGSPKTEAGKRSIPFPAMIYHELMAGKGEHLEHLQRLGQTRRLVFTDGYGEPLNRRILCKRFFALCSRAGVSTEGRSLYTLRRSHATLSLLAGENMKSLSERMGHSSVEFTENEYVDVLPVMRELAATRLEEKLLRNRLAPSGDERAM